MPFIDCPDPILSNRISCAVFERLSVWTNHCKAFQYHTQSDDNGRNPVDDTRHNYYHYFIQCQVTCVAMPSVVVTALADIMPRQYR